MLNGPQGRCANVPPSLVPSEGCPKMSNDVSRILRTHRITFEKQQKRASPPKL